MSNRPAIIFAAASLVLSTAPAFAQASGDNTAPKPNAPSSTTTEQKSTKPPAETGARSSSTPSGATAPQRPAAPQTSGSGAPDSGEGPIPLSSDDPSGLKKADGNSK
jgi:hypothetical protein